MPIDLRSKSSGGGADIVDFFSGGLRHTLSDLTPLVIESDGSSNYLRLDNLSASTGVSNVSNVSVQVGSRLIIDSLRLQEVSSSLGDFTVGSVSSDRASGQIFEINSATGENITVSTTETVGKQIVYSFSEVKS